MSHRLTSLLLIPGLLAGCGVPIPIPHSSLLAKTETHTARISRVEAPVIAQADTPFYLEVHVMREMLDDQVEAKGFQTELTPATGIVRVTGHTTRYVAYGNTVDPCAPPPPRSQEAESIIRLPLTLPAGTYSVQIPDFNHPEVATRSLVIR